MHNHTLRRFSVLYTIDTIVSLKDLQNFRGVVDVLRVGFLFTLISFRLDVFEDYPFVRFE